MKSIILLSLLFSSLSNAQWERVPEIPASRVVYSLLAVHDTLYAGTDSIVYVGINGGTLWTPGTPVAVTPDFIGCMVKVRNVLLAGTFHKGIFKSSNDGLSWQPMSSGLSGLGAMDVSNLLVRGDSVIAGTLGASVFITGSDLSHPWTPWGDSLADYQGDNVFKMLAVGSTVLAGAGANGYMFRYSDLQPWWNPIAINTPRIVGQIVAGMASGKSSVVAGAIEGFYRSTNEGVSWVGTNAVIPPLTFAISILYHDSTYIALTSSPLSSSLLKSSDEGQSWVSLGEIAIPNLLTCAVVDDTLFLGGGGGLWRAPLSRVITSAGVSSARPSVFRLAQNFPNPFNPTTTIIYELSGPSHVSLIVYDMLGRQVAVLVNGRGEAGVQKVTFDGSNLASGLYFYRLQAGTYVETKKLILLH